MLWISREILYSNGKDKGLPIGNYTSQCFANIYLNEEVAQKLEITEILNKYPYQISGGQKQRVASARAIITNPKIVLADEPTGALDSKSARQLLETFENLNKNIGATILMVTHDAFTASYADRIIFIIPKRKYR